MTYREKIIATAYTGIMFVDGEHLGDVYKYEEEKLGHGVIDIMHANKDFQKKIRDTLKEDFLKMIHCDTTQGITKEDLQNWKDEADASAEAYGALLRNEQRDYFNGQRDVYTFLLQCLYNIPFDQRVFPLDKEKRKKIINSIFDNFKPD